MALSDFAAFSAFDEEVLLQQQSLPLTAKPTTSSYVSSKYDIKLEDGVFKIFYNVEEGAEGNIVIDFSNDVIPMLNQWYQQYSGRPGAIYPMLPGDYNKIDIEITTSNGHTYRYKDGSFRLETADTSNYSDLSNFIGFDNQQIPLQFIGALSKSKPMQKLFGVNSSSKITVDMVSNLYGYLAANGYTGDEALTSYMLDYYNNELGTSYTSFNTLCKEHPEKVMAMQGGMADHQYTVSEQKFNELKTLYPEIEKFLVSKPKGNGSYEIQFKWPEESLASASYNLFYRELLSFAFGDKGDQEDFENMHGNFHEADLGVSNYMENTNDVWSQVNEFLKQASASGLNKEEASKLAISMAFGIDGPWTNNSYQNYFLSWYNSIELEQIDGDVTIQKIDSETGKTITDPATFNLYYYSVELAEDNTQRTVTYYYAIDENGNGYFTKDSSKAAALVTENGTCNVRYLLPDYEYYLREVKSPDGYQISDGEIKFTISSSENTLLIVGNTKTPDKPKPDNPKPDNPKPDNPKPDNPKPDNPKPDKPKPVTPTPIIPTPVTPEPVNPTPITYPVEPTVPTTPQQTSDPVPSTPSQTTSSDSQDMKKYVPRTGEVFSWIAVGTASCLLVGGIVMLSIKVKGKGKKKTDL